MDDNILGNQNVVVFFQMEYRLWLTVIGYIISGMTPFILFGLRINIQKSRDYYTSPEHVYEELEHWIDR